MCGTLVAQVWFLAWLVQSQLLEGIFCLANLKNLVWFVSRALLTFSDRVNLPKWDSLTLNDICWKIMTLRSNTYSFFRVFSAQKLNFSTLIFRRFSTIFFLSLRQIKFERRRNNLVVIEKQLGLNYSDLTIQKIPSFIKICFQFMYLYKLRVDITDSLIFGQQLLFLENLNNTILSSKIWKR